MSDIDYPKLSERIGEMAFKMRKATERIREANTNLKKFADICGPIIFQAEEERRTAYRAKCAATAERKRAAKKARAEQQARLEAAWQMMTPYERECYLRGK